MRLGKEKAVGYVEDTGYLEGTQAEGLPAEEAAAAPEGMPPATADEPSLTVS